MISIKNRKNFFFFNVLLIYLYENIKNNKTIVVIFAGRKKYLEILILYLRNLKNNKKIDEIHFWQFTNTKIDTEYLETISNIHKTSSHFLEYRSIYPEIKNNSFTISVKSNKGGGSILINNIYEFIINLEKNFVNFKKYNETKLNFFKNLTYECKEYNFIIKIINYNIIFEESKKILFKFSINNNNFNSIKIHSLNNSDVFWEYKESFNKGIKLFDTKFRSGAHWYEVYKFYLDYDFKILIKLDDDICFIDLNRFDEFINYIYLFQKNITIPNLVNHAVSLYYNNKYGLIPNNILKEAYQNQSSSLNIFGYFVDGVQGQKIHNYFLNNIKTFTNNNLKPKKLDGEKPSICMFGITKKSYNKIYAQNLVYNKNDMQSKNFLFNDENYTIQLLNNYIYPRFVCVHYSFFFTKKKWFR